MVSVTLDAAPPTDDVTDDMESLRLDAVEDMVSPMEDVADPAELVPDPVVELIDDLADCAEPITRSFMLDMVPLARSTRRAITLDGLTFSFSASTS
ncbi:MAG TPA: hypothetical protein VGP44_06845 [Gemmatimonadales bacterium]|nr:hypothetical protein [Gemmatimonadales bacterium]